MNKLQLLIDDYLRATTELQKALARPAGDELIQAGCIQYFQFCFELAWKSIKVALTEEGLPDCFSPKNCLKQAFTVGWIQREEVWLQMLEARNRMSHTYNAKAALDIYHRLPDFLIELKLLAGVLKNLV